MYTVRHNPPDIQELFIKMDNQVIDHFFESQISKTLTLAADSSTTYLVIAQNSDIVLDIITQGPHAQLKLFAIFLAEPGQKTKARISAQLSQDGVHIEMYLLSFLSQDANIDSDGSIDISPQVHKVQGHLLEENILLDTGIHIKTLPILNVASPDVKASHGAKIDKLDANKLFYMTSKGIAQSTAQNLIIDGYLQNILQHFTLYGEEEKQRIKQKIVTLLHR